MREFEPSTRRSKVPILALLVAGLTAGGAWEIAAHLDGAREVVIPDAPAEVEAPSPEKVLPQQPTERTVLPPRPIPEPVDDRQDLSAEPTFTPFTSAPDILNRAEVVAAMEAAYPPLLRNAGVGGTARIYFFIDAEGTVVKTQIDVGSGHAALDAAAGT